MKYTNKEVGTYYDEFTQIYEKATGNFIQAFRPTDENQLMDYVSKQLNVASNSTILDAGCGVGAPAIWLARHFEQLRVNCLTNSIYQYQKTEKAIQEAQLTGRITVSLGDYHQLESLYSTESFDQVIFLESLGHSHQIGQVIAGVEHVLKPGGQLYIKDFFKKKSKKESMQKEITEVIEIINSAYLYNTMDLAELIEEINLSGLMLERVQKPAIDSDVNITIKLEHQTRRVTYPYFIKTPAANWYEILAIKDYKAT